MNSPSSWATTEPQPSRMWRLSERALYWVRDVDVAEFGVDAVREGEVDDAVLAGEGDGGLGAITGEGEESFAGTTGEENTKRISHHAVLELTFLLVRVALRT